MLHSRMVCAGAGLALATAVSHAAFIKFSFEGSLEEFSPDVTPFVIDTFGEISGGETFTIDVVFDTTTLDLNPAATVGTYDLMTANASLNGVDAFSPGGQITIDAENDIFVLDASFDDLVFVNIMVDYDADVLLDDTLPLDLALPSEFPGGALTIKNDIRRVEGPATTFSAMIVPGPAAVALLGLGVATARRRRRD